MNITTELFTRHFLFFLKIQLITFKRLKIILTLEWLYIMRFKTKIVSKMFTKQKQPTQG